MNGIGTNHTGDLSTPEWDQQRSDIRNKLTPHLTDIAHSDNATKLQFSKSEVTQALLQQFIAIEGEYGATLQFTISEEKNHFQLSVTGPDGSEDLVRNFLAEASNIEKPLPGSGSAPVPQNNLAQGQKTKSYFGRVFTLCVICCAAPYAFVSFGIMSVSAGAYFGRILEISMILGALVLFGYFSLRLFRSRQSG